MSAAWWQHGIVYQIYPRSFMDSNGDGIGDLGGIIGRLDYLTWLGVDALWISPFYPSPMADFGYDVSDYTGIHPMFGTLEDFDRLIAEADRRGLKVILDFVPNHTSDQHPWFLESRESRDSEKRDWYIWHDPAPRGGLPNNWLSNFGGAAWEWDAASGQYYYHAFLKEQPDLNWRNPAVRGAMWDVLRFWLDRGVAGFRVDVIWLLIHDEQFRDNPLNPDYRPGDPPFTRFRPLYNADRPEVHDVIEEMRRVVDEYDDRVLIGEIYLPVERLVQYYGSDLRGLHLPFNFQLIQAAWSAPRLADMVHEYEAALPSGGWPNWVLGNHDNHRIATRVGAAQARVAAMLLLTLRGTPTLYYGDELGMQDVPIPPELVQDPLEKNLPGIGLGRDPERTPMRWDDGPAGGFTSGRPWLPLGDHLHDINVARQRDDPKSSLTLYRRLIELRCGEAALSLGAWTLVSTADETLAYLRRHRERSLLVVLNTGGGEHEIVLPEPARSGEVLLSTRLDRDGETVERSVRLRADEGLIVALR